MKSYKKQIALFLYVSLVIVIGSSAVLFINFRKQVKLQKEILQLQTSLIQADTLSNNLLQLESDKRGFQLTNDVNYLRNFYTLKSNSREIIAKLKKNTVSKAATGSMARIDSLVKLRMANLDSNIVVITTQGFDEGVAVMQLNDKKNTRIELYQQIALFRNDIVQRLKENSATINKRSRQNLSGILVLMAVFVLLILVAARTFRRSQQRIIKNHMKFKEAQRIARIGSWEWDFATDKLHWSQEQYRLFGESRETFDLTHNSYLKFLSPAGVVTVQALIRKALAGEANFAIEQEIIRKDGTSLMVFEQGTVLFDEHNRPTGMLGTTQDITERKKTERELTLAQKKFQAIFDNTADGIYQSTLDGKFLMVNASMAGIFGYGSPAELISSVTDIGSQIYADPFERNQMAAIISAQGHVENYELRVLTKNKNIIWVSANIRIVRDEKDGSSFFEGTLENITERKKAEEQLINLSNRLQLAVSATGIGIWDWDVVNDTTDWDGKMYHIYNVDPSDPRTVSASWDAAVHPDDLERVKEELQMAIRDEKEYDTEFRVIWTDKTLHYVKGNALVLRDADGTALRMIGTNTDITERKEAEEKIMQLNRHLDQFANITAHDLQEPIRMVSGFLGLLHKKYNDVLDDQGQSYIYRAKDGADRMSILIRDLLEYSRSGNKAAKKELVDMGTVMDLVDRDLSIVMADTGTIFRIPPSLPVLTGNQSALYRLFLNLVSNGIKFRKKDVIPEINLTVKEVPDFWEFTLQDNGIGVAEKDQPKLFQAFQRLHRREEYAGTGLGLVTCKKIVETHGGKIWITSEEGRGTSFHFTIDKDQQS